MTTQAGGYQELQASRRVNLVPELGLILQVRMAECDGGGFPTADRPMAPILPATQIHGRV